MKQILSGPSYYVSRRGMYVGYHKKYKVLGFQVHRSLGTRSKVIIKELISRRKARAIVKILNGIK